MKSGTSARPLSVVLALVVVATVVAGCAAKQATTGGTSTVLPTFGGSDRSSGVSPESAQQLEAGSAPPSAPTVAGTTSEADRMMIRSNTLRLEVESTPDAVSKIRELTTENAGVITDLQVATDTDDWLYRYDQNGYAMGDGAALRGWVTVRLPSESLAAFTKEVVALGTVKYQAEDTQDVTQQHVDMAARLENLKAEELRLRSFFDAAKNVQEMLAIETELNRVRSEIESLDAQVKYLERQAAMATVTIELTEKRPVVRPEGESWGFKEAITSGFRGAANVVNFVVSFLIATSPLWIVALVIALIVRTILRNRRRRRSANNTSPTADDAGSDENVGA